MDPLRSPDQVDRAGRDRPISHLARVLFSDPPGALSLSCSTLPLESTYLAALSGVNFVIDGELVELVGGARTLIMLSRY